MAEISMNPAGETCLNEAFMEGTPLLEFLHGTVTRPGQFGPLPFPTVSHDVLPDDRISWVRRTPGLSEGMSRSAGPTGTGALQFHPADQGLDPFP